MKQNATDSMLQVDPAIENYLKNKKDGTLNVDNKEIGLKEPSYGESQHDKSAAVSTIESGKLDKYREEKQKEVVLNAFLIIGILVIVIYLSIRLFKKK